MDLFQSIYTKPTQKKMKEWRFKKKKNQKKNTKQKKILLQAILSSYISSTSLFSVVPWILWDYK